MSVLRSSIENLHRSIMNLETAVSQAEENSVGQQRDMFSVAPSNENSTKTIDGSVIAKRLDNAISKVEELLKDGSNG